MKTRIYDVQGLLAGIDRKARVARVLVVGERGWTAMAVAKLVVVPELGAVRRLVEHDAAVFQAALPARSRQVRSWLLAPSGDLAGLWFLSSANQVGGIRVQVGRQRVRKRPTGRSGPGELPNAIAIGE